jgi:hypothetical protein
MSIVDSTGNAPKSTSTQHVRYIFADDVHTKLGQISAKEASDINSNKNIPKQLTPVTIMVVDTISSVESKMLLKFFLDSGLTTTMINRKCLPRNCQACKISNSRKISTLAGSYTSSEMVVLRILRLSCRYDVILRADFLSKTGIDVKYSTGTMEWSDNELPLRDTCYLKSKEFLAMAETIDIQLEDDFFGKDWYDPTCYASEILDAKYEKVLLDDVIDNLII